MLPYFRNISDQQCVYFFFLAWKNYFHFDKFRFSILQIFQIDFPFFLFHFHYLQWSKAHISKASFMWIEPTVSAIPTVLYVPSLPLWPLPPTILSNKYKPRFMCKIYCVQHSLLLEEERTRAFTMGGKENWKQKLFGVSFIYLSSAKIEDRFDYLILLVQFLKRLSSQQWCRVIYLFATFFNGKSAKLSKLTKVEIVSWYWHFSVIHLPLQGLVRLRSHQASYFWCRLHLWQM